MTTINNAEAGELFRSPSGLLTRTAWEDELESTFDQMPRWYRSAAERDRRFARWVHAEAKGLACHLDRWSGPIPSRRSPAISTLSAKRFGPMPNGHATASTAAWTRPHDEKEDS